MKNVKNAMERLNEAVLEKGPLVAGLDPDLKKVLELYKETGDILEEDCLGDELEDEYEWRCMSDFCERYIDAVKDKVAAIKINIAFFENAGMTGLFWVVVYAAKEAGLFVIADVKRADIGSTSEQYAEAFLCDCSIDAITVNPYFGFDGVKPFLDIAKEKGKGVFVLVKTSNKSSAEIQDLELKDGRKVYQQVAELVKKWGEYCGKQEDERYYPVGAVVGATHPDQAKELRQALPNTFFLVPGYGAQGAKEEDVVVNCDEEGGGAIINSSRGLMFAYEEEYWAKRFKPKEWDKATAGEVIIASNQLNVAWDSYYHGK